MASLRFASNARKLDALSRETMIASVTICRALSAERMTFRIRQLARIVPNVASMLAKPSRFYLPSEA